MKDMRFRYGLATLVLLAILAVLVVYAEEILWVLCRAKGASPKDDSTGAPTTTSEATPR